jgi:hypothetical protein
MLEVDPDTRLGEFMGKYMMHPIPLFSEFQ